MNNGTSTLIDLSHVIEDGLITYKGLPAPIVCDYLSRENSRALYEPGTEFQIAKIEMVANTGTYLDCPFHRYAHGDDLSQLTLNRLANLEGIVIRTTELAIDVQAFAGRSLRNKAVLIHTGWARHWRTDTYFSNHPYVTKAAAEFLRDSGALLVGIDSHNIDNTATNSRPAHSTLLGAGILIVEHLCNLESLPDEGFRFSAIPPKFKGVGTFPVRAFAELG